MSNQRYMMRGVSASKEDVHNAIKNIDKGIFPQAFCKIIPDILGGDPEYCNIMHADGAGTKSSLAYMYWKETGDLGVWKGIAQDALIMNIDDLLCVGAVDNILVSSTIGRNKLLIPGEVISAIINGTDELLAELREMGVGVYATGGINAYTHFTEFGKQFVRTVDDGGDYFAGNEQLVASDGGRYQNVVYRTHTKQVVDVHNQCILCNAFPHTQVAGFLPVHIGKTGLGACSIGMHNVAILRVTAQNVGDNFAESLRENTFVDILDGVVHIFL